MNLRPVLTRILLMNRLNQYKNRTFDLAKIKMAISYIRAIRSLRSFFLKIMAAALAIFLLINGLNLFYITFLFAPVTDVTQTYVMVFFLFYFAAVTGVVFYFASQRKWMEMFDIDEMVDNLKNGKKE